MIAKNEKGKKKGFTLLELLAVLVILAALATIAIPIFSNKSDIAKQKAHEQNLEILQKQGNSYLLGITVMPADGEDLIDELETHGYIKEIPTNPITGVKDYHVIYHSATNTVLVRAGEVVADVLVAKYIKFGTYNGQTIVWRVIHKQDVNGDTNDDLMLLADRIISLKAFDAAGDASEGRGDGNRTSYGSNYWEKSNLREWLNSSAGVGAVAWTHNPPTNANVWTNYNEYDAEKGFLADGNFTATDRSKILSPSHKVILADIDASIKDGGTASHTYNNTNPSTAVANYSDAYYEDIADDKVFLLGIKELYEYVYNNASLGDGTTWYKAKPTTQAVSNSEYTNINLSDTKDWCYWLRDSYTTYSYYPRRVNTDGSVDGGASWHGEHGIRPALFLSPVGMTLDGASGDSAGAAYTITWE